MADLLTRAGDLQLTPTLVGAEGYNGMGRRGGAQQRGEEKEMLWTIVGWIVFGLIVGFIARALVPGRDNIGVLRTIVLGVIGSVLGGFVFGLFTVGFRGFQPAGWIGSIIGAVIVLLLYNKFVLGSRKRV